MEFLLYASLVLLGIALDRAWLWARAMDRTHYPLFDIEYGQRDAMREIAARRRRAEEQMRRMVWRGWVR